MQITKLDTYGTETAGQKFTKGLRGMLGGREITPRADGRGVQEKKIYCVAIRILLALALVLSVVGLLYTIPAAIIVRNTPRPEQLSVFAHWSEQRQQESFNALMPVANQLFPFLNGALQIHVNSTNELQAKATEFLEDLKTSTDNSPLKVMLLLDTITANSSFTNPEIMGQAFALLSINLKKFKDENDINGPLEQNSIQTDFSDMAVDF